MGTDSGKQERGLEYYSVKTGNKLTRRPNCFYWRGRSFSGLVDEKANALYDDPEDCFMEAVTGKPQTHELIKCKTTEEGKDGK
jgi:hypothetical protein